MKPKTKIQKEISEDQKKLSKITDKHKNHALKLHDKFVSLTYTTKHHCLDCGHEWKASNKETIKKGKCTCPSCKTTLKVAIDDSRVFDRTFYYAILDRVKDKQVIRAFHNKVYYQRGKAKTHHLTEVFQFWILENGNVHFMTKARQSFSYYYDSYCSYSDIEFRNVRPNVYNQILFQQFDFYPYKKIIPKLRRNGFKGDFLDIAPQRLFPKLLTSNAFETLIKADQKELIYSIDKHSFDLDKYWGSVKLLLKYNYKPLSYDTWFDYIKMLDEMDKDLNNPKLILPEDLTQAHDLYVKKVDKKRADELLVKKRIEVSKDRREYAEKKMMFFNLFFKRERLTIEPLKSVDDFIDEAKEMKHCVFSSDYHKKEDSLILSAKVDGKRVETVQVDLNKFKIIQSRGKFNSTSKFNSEIREIVNSNMEQIKQIQLTA